MYICSECGAKYDKMPKYCDCGNDIFEQIAQEITDDLDDLDNLDNIDNLDDIDNLSDIQEPNFDSQVQRRSGYSVQKSYSPVAIAVFSLCIILSLVILFFVGNPQKEAKPADKEVKEVAQNIEIPPIDSYWDNTVAKTEQKQEPEKEQSENKIIDMMPKFVQQIIPVSEQKPVQKQEQKPIKQAQTKQPVKTTAQKSNAVQSSAQKTNTKTSQTSVQSTAQPSAATKALTNKIKNNIQFTSNTQQKPAAAQTGIQNTQSSAPVPTKTSTTAQTSVTQTVHVQQNKPTTQSQTQQTMQTQQKTQTQQTVQVATKSQAELKKELNTYKASLRNTIGKKIDFTKVIGDGDCSLSFKINSNGRLVSKAFTKQSSNITLNDAAYAALNSTTSFNPPPEGYKGETLNLYIKFYNGNFEISLN